MLRARARHGKPQTHVDEQPAGSVAGGRDKSEPASDVRRRASGVPKLVDTAPDDCILDGWVLVHGLLLSTRTLVTRLLVTRTLVKQGI
jgi:hypothetical protein